MIDCSAIATRGMPMTERRLIVVWSTNPTVATTKAAAVATKMMLIASMAAAGLGKPRSKT